MGQYLRGNVAPLVQVINFISYHYLFSLTLHCSKWKSDITSELVRETFSRAIQIMQNKHNDKLELWQNTYSTCIGDSQRSCIKNRSMGLCILLCMSTRATEILKSKSVRSIDDVIDVIGTCVRQFQIVTKTNDSSFSSKSVLEIDYFSNTL